MDLNKNVLNSTQFQTLLPLNPNRYPHQRPMLDKYNQEEVMQSFNIKKNALMKALQSKREGKLKNYYQIINRQGFVNAKEEQQALRIWVKVFLETISIIYDYQNHELLELIVFKLPWFTPTTTHGQNFNCFMRLCLALFPLDVSYIHKVIKHIFSPRGLFQCVMLGEHWPALADLLWEKTQLIIKSLQLVDVNAKTDDRIKQVPTELNTSSDRLDETKEMVQSQQIQIDTEIVQNGQHKIIDQDQITLFQKSLKDLKTSEDILARAKIILRKYSDQNQSSYVQVTDLHDELFLKVLFSFYSTRSLPSDYQYSILIGKCYGYPTYFVNSQPISIELTPSEDDLISLKKCLSEIAQAYSMSLKIFAEKKYSTSTLKKLGIFFSKLMSLYPSFHQFILQNLLEKLPNKSMPIENQYLYYQMTLNIAKAYPEYEEKILLSIVERLCHLDVDLKAKVRKFQFSQMSKIQPMNSYIKELQMKLASENETKMSILFEMLLQYILDKVKQLNDKNASQANCDEFIDMIMKIFESKIFPIHKLNYMQYLPLYVISLSIVNDKLTVFTEKYLSFLTFKSFNMIEKEHLSTRQQAWNYLSSLLSRQNKIINDKTFMKGLKFIVKYFETNFKAKIKSSQRTNNHSATETLSNLGNSNNLQQNSQGKIFQHCYIQGLTLILTSKIDQIQQYDHDLFTLICKQIFKKNFDSLFYASPLILSDLMKLIDTDKLGLGVFKQKLRTLFKQQFEELKSSKRQVYNKVQKFMAYETPITTYPASEKFLNLMIYTDLSNTPTFSIDKILKADNNQILTESTVMIENETHIKPQFKYGLNNEEKKNLNTSINQSDSSQAVLYVPDPALYPSFHDQMEIDSPMKNGFSLEKAITNSRGDKVYLL